MAIPAHKRHFFMDDDRLIFLYEKKKDKENKLKKIEKDIKNIL